jgi:hypothetical protein
MAYDALLALQAAAVTKTAAFDSAAVDLKSGGTGHQGLVARIVYSAAATSAGAGAIQFDIEHSDDDSTYYILRAGADEALTLSTTAQAGEIWLPFKTTKRYVRLALQAISGTDATITYRADIGLSSP